MTLPSDPSARTGQAALPRRSYRAGRPVPFRVEPTGDPIFDGRLILPGELGGWIVLSFSADALAPAGRPILRIVRAGGEAETAVLPGPALGRSYWTGLIPDDAREIFLSIGRGVILERVGRRSGLGIFLECLRRRPGNAFAALDALARGQARRVRDTLRGGVAVTRRRNSAVWFAERSVPYAGPVPPLAIRCVVLVARQQGRGLGLTLDSLGRQTFAPAGTEVLREAPGPTGSVWDPGTRASDLLADGDALCLLRAGDVLMPDALALLAARLGQSDLAYADELSQDGSLILKPDWSPDLAVTTGYPGRPVLLSRGLIERLPADPLGPIQEADVALGTAAAIACRQAVHCPRPLVRVSGDAVPVDRGSILARCLAAAGMPARLSERNGVPDLLWPLPDPVPLASVVIPSKDRLDLITPACRGVLESTDYPALELIVVDNGSTDPAVLAFYDELRGDRRVRIVPYPHPFNFSAMVNAGVAASSGAVVVLLNNDIGVRDAGWLAEMVRQALRPEVGAVGAKLLFGDGKLQHAGVVVGLAGRAGHILRRRPADTPGRLGQLHVAHEVSAVTAACLAVARGKYDAVGGFDAEAFPVDFNDVDFCLRLAAAGYRCVFTPAAELFHFESVSRGPSVGTKRERFEREAARFTDRWLPVIRHDPFYHPALSLTTFGEDLE